MKYRDLTTTIGDLRPATWILAYATVDVPLARAMKTLMEKNPGVPIFGCTSFQGVFSPSGFTRGLHVLTGEPSDTVEAKAVSRAVGGLRARSEASAAAAELRSMHGGAGPASILMHATPGFEERVLEGIDDAFGGNPPPVYGGSAADDTISGEWKVFHNDILTGEGFVLVGFWSKRRVFGSFVAGYAPTTTRGTVTAANGRVIKTIDGKPAAQIYNEWTHGGIAAQMSGGTVLAATTLRPLGRVVDKVGAVPRYLLSHPHEVQKDGSLALFTDVAVGDELVLMLGTEAALLERTNQVANRALASGGADEPLSGSILIYCGGCVGALGDNVPDVSNMFKKQLHGAPFVGAATFGEQGCFTGPKAMNRHGNLMCNAIMFAAK
jgi:hypothetical protein